MKVDLVKFDRAIPAEGPRSVEFDFGLPKKRTFEVRCTEPFGLAVDAGLGMMPVGYVYDGFACVTVASGGLAVAVSGIKKQTEWSVRFLGGDASMPELESPTFTTLDRGPAEHPQVTLMRRIQRENQEFMTAQLDRAARELNQVRGELERIKQSEDRGVQPQGESVSSAGQPQADGEGEGDAETN
jgi:hypothetical protein